MIVVDNDPEASAATVVETLGSPGLTYVHEPRPGIAAARNSALAAAVDLDTLVFIDDDETPVSDWLATMVAAHDRFGGAAVVGPVLRVHEVRPADWVLAARIFERRRMPTGTPRDAAGTGNLLLDLHHVRRHSLSFDDRLGLAGGSDHLFTRQIRRTGGLIHWCDEAVVEEFVPADRLTGRWTLRRGYRSGNTSVLIERMLADSFRESAVVRVRALVGGLARLMGGAARSLVGLATRRPDLVGRGAWTAARGAGMLGAAVGRTYVEYSR